MKREICAVMGVVIASAGGSFGQEPGLFRLYDEKPLVSVQKQKSCHIVSIEDGDPAEIGRQYALAIKDTSWTVRFDAYLLEVLGDKKGRMGESLETCYQRATDLLPALSEAHRAELMAFAEVAADTKESKPGDGKLSKEEVIVVSFIPEVVRFAACSAISVFGDAAGGGNRVGRVLDWYSGRNQELNHINAVIIRKSKRHRATVSVGYLGYLPALTSLNEKGLFAALFTSDYPVEYKSKDKRSYAYDLRAAMEAASSLEEVTSVLMHADLRYPAPFNSMVADGGRTVVVESASPKGLHGSALRLPDSPLNPGIAWGFSNAIAVVNSNVQSGHEDNHTKSPWNRERWDAYQKLFGEASKDGQVSLDEIRGIVTFRQAQNPGMWGKNSNPELFGRAPADIFNSKTQQVILWDSGRKSLQVWFRQADGKGLPAQPAFEDVALPWSARTVRPRSRRR